MTAVGVLVGVLSGKQGEYVVDYSEVNQALAPIPWGRRSGTPGGIRTPDPRFRRSKPLYLRRSIIVPG